MMEEVGGGHALDKGKRGMLYSIRPTRSTTR
jgi:hypothetical protein